MSHRELRLRISRGKPFLRRPCKQAGHTSHNGGGHDCSSGSGNGSSGQEYRRREFDDTPGPLVQSSHLDCWLGEKY